MKKVLFAFALLALGLNSVAAFAQDDVYFVPTKKAILKERQTERASAQREHTESTYTTIYDNATATEYDGWADRNQADADEIDAYNRHGSGLLVESTPSDSLAGADSTYNAAEEDYSPTARLVRFRSPRGVIYASPYYADYIYDLAFYDPWYFDGFYGSAYWHYGWAYNPFFYDPWFYGTWWGSPWHHHCGWYDYCWGWGPTWHPGWHPGWGPGWGHGGYPSFASGRSNGRLTGHNFSRPGSAAGRGTSASAGRQHIGSRDNRNANGRITGSASRSFGSGRNTGSLGTRYSGSSSRNPANSSGFVRNEGTTQRRQPANTGSYNRQRSSSSSSSSMSSGSRSGRSFSSGSSFSGGSSHSSGSRGGGFSGGGRSGGRR